MPSKADQLLQALKSFTAVVIAWAPKSGGGHTTTRRPREAAGPDRKRRRGPERDRHYGSQHKRRQDRQQSTNQALENSNSRTPTRPRPRSPQGSSRSSRSPSPRVPEAIPVDWTAAPYEVFPGMSAAMIRGYEDGALPFKEVTPVITTRLTRAGRSKLTVKLREKRPNPPSDVLASLKKGPSAGPGCVVSMSCRNNSTRDFALPSPLPGTAYLTCSD